MARALLSMVASKQPRGQRCIRASDTSAASFKVPGVETTMDIPPAGLRRPQPLQRALCGTQSIAVVAGTPHTFVGETFDATSIAAGAALHLAHVLQAFGVVARAVALSGSMALTGAGRRHSIGCPTLGAARKVDTEYHSSGVGTKHIDGTRLRNLTTLMSLRCMGASANILECDIPEVVQGTHAQAESMSSREQCGRAPPTANAQNVGLAWVASTDEQNRHVAWLVLRIATPQPRRWSVDTEQMVRGCARQVRRPHVVEAWDVITLHSALHVGCRRRRVLQRLAPLGALARSQIQTRRRKRASICGARCARRVFRVSVWVWEWSFPRGKVVATGFAVAAKTGHTGPCMSGCFRMAHRSEPPHWAN